MDYATTDLVLAIVHHLLVFVLAGILAFEIGTVSLTMKRDEILRVGRVDIWYGILTGVIIVVGFTRATVAAKGWAYYSVNVFFWAKIGTFLVIGLLSIVFPARPLPITDWNSSSSGIAENSKDCAMCRSARMASSTNATVPAVNDQNCEPQ